nr:hypothetical protein [uncultured Blautia sp.]
MMKIAIGLIALMIHMVICILIWLGIRTGLLKVKMYMLPLALFVPVWGPVCVLLIHFQIFSGADQVKKVGVEKLRVNEEIYKNMFQTREENDRDVVPLEEALLLNDPGKRRELIMNILNDDPGEYVELLKQARMNEDVEVVHYAITAMVELSKEYDYRQQKIEKKYMDAPDDPAVLEEYCDFLKEYLSQGFTEKQMEQIQRKQYTQLLLKQLGQKVNLHTCVCLMENLMVQGDFALAEKTLKIMDQNWHRSEEYWIWKIRYLAERKMGREIKESLKALKEEHIYLSSKGKEALEFWLIG